MNFRLNSLVAALVSGGACGIGHAAASFINVAQPAPEIRNESRTVIIDGHANVIEREANADVVIAQGSADGQKREVRIVRRGAGAELSELRELGTTLGDLPDINVLVSSAMSEAFSGGGIITTAKSVKNAPYSAEVISEKTQTLPDGNQITRKSSTYSWRDSAGRTRQETRDAKGDVRSVQIHDAVEGSRYVLSPSKKTATRISIDKDLKKRIEEIKEKAKAMARDGKAHIIERGNPGEEIVMKRIESPVTDGKKEIREEVKVRVVRASGATGASAVADAGAGTQAYTFKFSDGETIGNAIGESMRHGPIGMSFQDMKWSGKSTTNSLGFKDFDGVRAEGKNVSYTIPASEIGNKNPIVVSTETWTSPDLQIVVYSKHSDPRVGETLYRLANLKRGEPPVGMFTVPDGYVLKEMPGLSLGAKAK